MTVIERMERCIVGRVTFPLTNYFLNRRNILSRYESLCCSEWQEQDRLRRLQADKLKQLITYSYERVPFYARRFKAIALEPGDITSLDDLKRVPALSRQEVIEHRCEMVSAGFSNSIISADQSGRRPGEPIPFAPFRRHKLVRNTSSGSTGAPTVFYEDGSNTALNWALELRLKSWFGMEPGAREARMVRLSTDKLGGGKTLKLRNRLWNQLLLPGVNLTDANYSECITKLATYRPKVLWGFTSALAGLAGYIRRCGIDPSLFGIRLIVGWAAPVYDHERTLLEQVFSCPVSNIYSAREVGHIAGMCAFGSLHVNQEHLLLERDDKTGELLATSLDLSPMPFIRYRMGDIGTLVPSQCGCGRTLQVIGKLLGRTGEIFTTEDGRMISPNFWCRTFMSGMFAGAVKRFQVIYRNDGAVGIKLVRSKHYSSSIETALKTFLADNFHRDMKFKFEYVEIIEPSVSGKYQMVVNEIGGGK